MKPKSKYAIFAIFVIIITRCECKTRRDKKIHGGEKAIKNEFPHMALIGFVDPESGDLLWECGGSIIDEYWILTAAHCTWSKTARDKPKFVRIGDDDLDKRVKKSLVFRIEEILCHPEYVGNKVYNDIALVKLKKKIEFSNKIHPACVHDPEDPEASDFDDGNATAIGWGHTSYRAERSNCLLKVTLEKFDYDDCKDHHKQSRRQPEGLVNDTQICYGHKTEAKDTCQGDSGGPLHVKKEKGDCEFIIIGLTSVGKACGTIGVPAIYTRLSAFIPWIEKYVNFYE